MELKKNMLWISALIGMMVIGTAVTVTFDNEADARNAVGTSVSIAKSDRGCEIMSIEKRASTADEITNNDYTITWAMWYEKDGTLTRKTGQASVKTASDLAVKAAVQAPCETAWAQAQAEGTVDSVIIKPEIGALNELYDYVARKWETKTAQQITP